LVLPSQSPTQPGLVIGMEPRELPGSGKTTNYRKVGILLKEHKKKKVHGCWGRPSEISSC